MWLFIIDSFSRFSSFFISSHDVTTSPYSRLFAILFFQTPIAELLFLSPELSEKLRCSSPTAVLSGAQLSRYYLSIVFFSVFCKTKWWFFFFQDQFVKYYILLTDFAVSTVTPRGGRTFSPYFMELIQIKRSTVYHLNVKFVVTIITSCIHTDFSGDRAITWDGMVFCEVHSSHCSTCAFSRDINSC